MRRQPLLVFTLACFAGVIASPPSLRAQTLSDGSPNSEIYRSIVAAGPQDAKTTITLFWSAVSEPSLREYKSRIEPILRAGPPKSMIVLSQVLDIRHHDLIGPGAFLLCGPDYKSYARNVLRYMQLAEKVTAVTPRRGRGKSVMYTNIGIERLRKEKKIDVEACLESGPFYARQMQNAAKAKQYYEAFGSAEVPRYMINDEKMKADDPRVAQALAAAR